MKQKTYCSFRFDRKKQVEARGYGNVEVQIRLSPSVRTYIKIKECTPKEWNTFSKSKELKLIMAKYESIALSIITSGEEITKECLNAHLGREVKEEAEELNKYDSFIDFMCAGIATDQIEPRTKDHRMVALRNLEQFGKIKTFADLTPNNISKYDEWLRSDPSQPKRSDTTIKDYHKTIHRYVMRAFERGIIERAPYRSVTIKHGKNKERTPLVEEELLVLRNLHLTGKLEKVRDLFIFAAYTGMAYVEVMNFDFFTMTEQKGDLFYIESKRAKTDSKFFTPILPPAMAILKKYKFRLPKISNQKVNDYLHLLEEKANIHKPMTFHVASHSISSFALKTNDLRNLNLQQVTI